MQTKTDSKPERSVPLRSMDEITKEYAHQVQVAGETQYRISVLQGDLQRMNARLADLNKEALEVQAQNETKVEVTNEQG